MAKKFFFYFLLCCLTIVLSLWVASIDYKQNIVKYKPATRPKINMNEALKKAFDEGYFNGRNSYIAQESGKSYEYTSFIKKHRGLTENQIKVLERASQKGYLKGYHKAATEFSCPMK